MTGIRWAIAAIFVLWGLAPALAGATMAPHVAVYDLTLKSASERARVAGASGRMVIEVTGAACEGWTVNFRMVTNYSMKNGQQRVSDNRSSSWESDDGNTLRFSQQHFINDKPQTDSLLSAERKPDGTVDGAMSKPKRGAFDIPDDAIFPIQHQRQLIDKARAGKSRDRSVIFDGSDGDKSHVAVTFIGKPHGDKEQGGEGADALAGLSSWPVQISYYSTDPASGDLPVYQVGFRLYENGIAGDLTLDYGVFAMSGKLSRLKMGKAEPCD